MMQFYLIHKRHGKKIAHQDKEAEADKKNGWTEVSEDEFYGRNKAVPETTKAASDEDDAERAALAKAYEEKYGKKPHHRMSAETLRAALEAE